MNPIKSIAKEIVTTDIAHHYISKAYHLKYPGSRQYWEDRYQRGDNSGAGSYGKLARFKSNVLENFIDQNEVKDVIEFGCGDGNQLSMTEFPPYIGLDVSSTAIQMCINKFEDEEYKSFFLYNPESFVDNRGIFKSDLGLSLDVIYHLTEDDIYQKYMEDLFSSSRKYVIIYSSNTTKKYVDDKHVKHRKFTNWVENNARDWELDRVIDNKYSYDPSNPENTSWSDFYIFKHTSH
ncbi:class I SAM-dependent methyltransferase [Haloarcula salina]|uniref:Class I SAM-dependent methyltransferase n=1 Tax=Haloarcula salina TaxID=1429914 RepID=A0AA41FX38_9EURY|nr:class I SAM-dependent methyltransferase [Haloarcula salina]MBV0900410.1 class I SAM-dependent methyltransferase [Haloarcula salina]